jgi:predicted nucleic acid-binding protein
MKVLFDTNVILDIMLERQPFLDNSKKALQHALAHGYQVFLTATTATDLYYLVRKAKDKATALNLLAQLLQVFDVTLVDKHVLLQALQSASLDFEDAVQISSAQNQGLDMIITRNVADFRDTDLPIHTPESFLATLT